MIDTWYHMRYSVVVSTPDSESGNPGSNPGTASHLRSFVALNLANSGRKLTTKLLCASECVGQETKKVTAALAWSHTGARTAAASS